MPNFDLGKSICQRSYHTWAWKKWACKPPFYSINKLSATNYQVLLLIIKSHMTKSINTFLFFVCVLH